MHDDHSQGLSRRARRLRGLARFAATAVACAAFVLVPAAHAEAGTLSASCSDRGHYLNSWSYYTPSGASNQWTQFQYQLGGSGTGGESNVNFWVYENSTVRYWNKSPDTLDNGPLYTVTPPWQVFTAA